MGTSREKFSFIGLILDLIKLAIFLLLIYSIYLGVFVGYHYVDIKDTTDIIARYASTTINDTKIRNMMKSYCMENEKIDCRKDSFKVERTFEYAKVSIKYNFKVRLFWIYPISLTFEPESKEIIPVFEL